MMIDSENLKQMLKRMEMHEHENDVIERSFNRGIYTAIKLIEICEEICEEALSRQG